MKQRRIATHAAVIRQAWRAAQRRIELEGVAQLSIDEEAGRLLAKWQCANVAHAMCPEGPVRDRLEDVINEERGAPSPGRNAS